METKAHYALIGGFVVALTAAMVVFVIWLSQASFTEEFSEYKVVFQGPVRGLSTASDVRFNGVKVGEVVEVGFDQFNDQYVSAVVRLRADTPVKSDSLARLEPQGITGLAYIQITGGGMDSPAPQPWALGELPRIESEQASLDLLFQGGEDVVQNANVALSRVNALLSPTNVENLTQTVEALAALSAQLEDNKALVGETRQAIQELNAAAASIKTAADQLSDFAQLGSAMLDNDLTPALIAVDDAARRVDAASADASSLLIAMQPALNRFSASGLDEISLAAGDTRRLVQILERIALEVERNPAAFLSGSTRGEVEIAP